MLVRCKKTSIAAPVCRKFASSAPPTEPPYPVDDNAITADETKALVGEDKFDQTQFDGVAGEGNTTITFAQLETLFPVSPRPSFASVAVAELEVVVIGEVELADTLEWCLDSPPTLHQFEESPIVVEIAHLM